VVGKDCRISSPNLYVYVCLGWRLEHLTSSYARITDRNEKGTVCCFVTRWRSSMSEGPQIKTFSPCKSLINLFPTASAAIERSIKIQELRAT
jgi:hypothetical protein